MNSIRRVLGRGASTREGLGGERDLFTEATGEHAFKRKVDCSAEDFELGVTLGTGTFGRVRLAKFKRASEIEHAQNYYALKLLKKSEILRLKQLAHIKNETIILSKLEHPFIVCLVNHYQDTFHITMVLEFVSGGELFSVLRDKGRLPASEAQFYAGQVMLALGYLHGKKIAYRDLKPENLLLDRKGFLRVADFGFAKVIEQRTWTVCGTPEYLAPEIIQSKGHGMPVDWWAFGVLIFEMLSGEPPFVDETPLGIYQRILAGNIEYPRYFDAKATALLKALLKVDLSKRIGCLRAGPTEIQHAKWFSKMDWNALYDRTCEAPFVPDVADENDTSAFDEYEESPPNSMTKISAADEELFEDFDIIGFQSNDDA